MEIVTGYGGLASPEGPLAATIGNFDGVHLGHQALIARARSEARSRGLSAAVVTFDPHPLRVLAPERAPKMILTRRQRIEILASLGIDRIVFIPFSREIAGIPAEEFVRRFLVDRLRAAVLVVGQDFRFGKDRAGDVSMLRRLGAVCGFEVFDVAAVELGGTRVSASQVREAILSGRMRRAAELMGRSFVLVGEVVHGEGRGRTIGIPTANLAPENEIVPGSGVYITQTLVELEWHPSLTNIGSRPTFEGAGFAIETWLPEFEGNLYNQRLRVRFIEKIRDEKRFESSVALRAQIAEDLDRLRAWSRSSREREEAP